MIIAHLSRSLRETFPARASEWALGTILFNWSLVLLFNEALFSAGRSYAVLGQLMGQETWAGLCLVCGGGRLLILAINGAWRRSPHLRALFAFLSCFFWFQITLGMAQAGTQGTGLAVYPVLFLLDAFNTLRAMGEAGLSDRIHGRKQNGPSDA